MTEVKIRRRLDGLCTTCHGPVPELRNDLYCHPCRRAMDKRTKEARKHKPKVARRDSCNCGDPSCNGMTCDRVIA